MESQVLVEFRNSPNNSFCPLQFIDSFDSIKSYCNQRWPVLKDAFVEYQYSYGTQQGCVMVNDMDYNTIKWLVNRNDEIPPPNVIIDVIPRIIPSSAPTSGDSGTCSTYTTATCSSRTTHELISQNSQVTDEGVDNVRRDTDQMRHKRNEKVLLSADWDKCLKSIGDFYYGGINEFRFCLGKYACESGYDFEFVHNSSSKASAYCKNRKSKDCKWYVYVVSDISKTKLHVRSFVKEHTCGPPDQSMTSDRLTSDVVMEVIMDEIRSKPATKPTDIVVRLKDSYGFDISYKVAYTAVTKARKCLYGDVGLSYNRISPYFDKLKAADPSSQVSLQVDPITRTFESCNVAFGACLAGFRSCRPLLFIDGTFLKNKYKGVLLIATAKDANSGLFPVAFSIVRTEDGDTWTQFLNFLYPHVSDREITFVSDRHPGIALALRTVFPNSHHAFCMVHLKKNLRLKCKGGSGFAKSMASYLNDIAYAVNETEYNACVAAFLKAGKEKAEEFLGNLPKEQFSDAFFKGKRYGEMTSNAAESFNNQIKSRRELPVTELIDSIRNMLMVQMYDRLVKAEACKSTLSSMSHIRYANNFKYCRSWVVKQCSNHVFQVQSNPIMTVDLEARTCSCYSWQITGFPCVHVVCALEKSRKSIKYTYVDQYYHASKYRETYSLSIPSLSTFQDADLDSAEIIVLPPKYKKMPGRPKKNRMPSGVEYSRKKRMCGRCKQPAYHNKATCTVALV